MKRFGKIMICVVLCILCFLWVTYNFLHNSHFLEASLYNLLSIAIAVIVTYFFVQKKNDERKLKDIFDNIIVNIQERITSETSFKFNSNSNTRDILQMIRVTKNKLTVLASQKDRLNIKDETAYIESKFDEYRETIGDYLDRLEELPSKEPEIRKLLNSIDNKCDEIRVKLYQ